MTPVIRSLFDHRQVSKASLEIPRIAMESRPEITIDRDGGETRFRNLQMGLEHRSVPLALMGLRYQVLEKRIDLLEEG